jgi:hypothetical protein
MEFWSDSRKIAFAEKSFGTSFALDVWEECGLAGHPFKHSASFMFETDARSYLATKYPHAAEQLTDALEHVTAKFDSSETNPPYDLIDEAAWRRSREDGCKYRTAMSEDAA